MPDELRKALITLSDEDMQDRGVYMVRDSEHKGWDGPRVLAYAAAWVIINKYIKEGADVENHLENL